MDQSSEQTDNSQQPIGVFDSGVGGLSVLAHIRQRLPRENLLYAADSAFAPYGEKTTAEIRKRVLKVSESLLELGAKALVVACNTATAAAVHQLRERYPHLPVVGMEPGLKPAVNGSRKRRVGVLATTGTLSSDRFRQLMERYASGTGVMLQPCPGLVEQVEQGAFGDSYTESLLNRYLEPLLHQEVDTLVLGCTHYPFLSKQIRQLAGDHVAVIDTGPAVARQVEQRLIHHQLLNIEQDEGDVQFFTSGDPVSYLPLFNRLWGDDVVLQKLV